MLLKCFFFPFFFPYSRLLVFLVGFFWFFFWLLLHLYTERMKRFELPLCRLGWSVKEPGGGEERSLKEISCSSQNDTFIRIFPLPLSDMRAFLMWRNQSFQRFWSLKVPSPHPVSLSPPSTAAPCFLRAECRLIGGGGGWGGGVPCHQRGAAVVQDLGLSWHPASSPRLALHLHINLHKTLIGDKCTCFFIYGALQVYTEISF